MRRYNKLVRDNIPQIIMENEGRFAKTRTLNDEEFLQELHRKLQEELREYLSSGDIEELADLEEVIRGVLDAKHVKYEDFEKIRKDKAEKRGSFKKRIFLETVEND